MTQYGDAGDQNIHPTTVQRCTETIDLFITQEPHQAHSATSRAAALGIAGKAGTLRRLVYDCLVTHGPATDREMQSRLSMAGSTQRPRRVRLVQLGLVKDSGKQRKHEGRSATVWQVAQ